MCSSWPIYSKSDPHSSMQFVKHSYVQLVTHIFKKFNASCVKGRASFEYMGHELHLGMFHELHIWMRVTFWIYGSRAAHRNVSRTAYMNESWTTRRMSLELHNCICSLFWCAVRDAFAVRDSLMNWWRVTNCMCHGSNVDHMSLDSCVTWLITHESADALHTLV